MKSRLRKLQKRKHEHHNIGDNIGLKGDKRRQKLTLRTQLTFIPWQKRCFFDHDKKRILVKKGRRVGFTKSAANWLIYLAIKNKISNGMWGDTIAGNIHRYVNRYFRPVLENLRRKKGLYWKYSQTYHELHIHNTVIDLRSADKPENWEGFGYDLILLNEAGIILNNEYLLENAIRPMLLDNPDSILVVGGTPKGRWSGYDAHKFWELYESAKISPDTWHLEELTTYDNPLLSIESIDEMVADMPETIARQEIFGEFIDTADSVLISCSEVMEATKRGADLNKLLKTKIKIAGIDVGWSNDPIVITVRVGNYVYDPIEIQPVRDDFAAAQAISSRLKQYSPDILNIDYGWGTGIISHLANMGWNKINGIFFQSTASDPLKYSNKRAEMYDLGRRYIQGGGALPDNNKLVSQMCSILVGVDGKGRLSILDKDTISRNAGTNESTNHSDSFVLTFAAGIREDRHGNDEGLFSEIPTVGIG